MIALFNHSCDPNMSRIQNGRYTIGIANRTIQKNDEVWPPRKLYRVENLPKCEIQHPKMSLSYLLLIGKLHYYKLCLTEVVEICLMNNMLQQKIRNPGKIRIPDKVIFVLIDSTVYSVRTHS